MKRYFEPERLWSKEGEMETFGLLRAKLSSVPRTAFYIPRTPRIPCTEQTIHVSCQQHVINNVKLLSKTFLQN